MRRHGLAALALLLGLALPIPARAQAPEWLELASAREARGVQAFQAEIEYAAGRISVFPADAGVLYDARLRYDATQFEPRRRWSIEDGRAVFRLDIDGREDVDIQVRDLSDRAGSLRLGLSRSVPTDLRLTVGGAEAKIDLGGVALSGLDLKLGAADSELRFDEPNPASMRRLTLKAAVAAFSAYGLGNAHFERLEFDGGIGDLTLDFTGEWDRSAVAKVKMGVGSLRLRVPADIGVKIRKRTFLAAFDANGFRKVDGGYVSPNWDASDIRLDIDLEAALGSVGVTTEP
ncbi:MAG: hypothetical protein ACE5HF_01580 [Gemmatimonadota bacterium]